MERQAHVGAATPEEERLLRAIAACKDQLLQLTPGFPEAAAKARARLKPLAAEELQRYFSDRASLPKKRVRAVERSLAHNTKLARAFARTWTLPLYEMDWIYHPDTLFESPFSRTCWIEGIAAAVYEWDGIPPPVVVLEVDIRYPLPALKRVIGERLQRGQREWRARGGETWPKLRDEAKKLRHALAAHLWKGKKTNGKIAEELVVSKDHVPALRRECRRLVEEKAYRTLAPYTLPEWIDGKRRSLQHLPLHVSKCVALVNEADRRQPRGRSGGRKGERGPTT